MRAYARRMPAPTADADTADGYALALEEARRALDEQERAVAQLSARAGTLLSAAAIATSFLGGTALSHDQVSVLSWVAIAAFVGLCVATVSILVPRRDWEFSIRPALVIRAFVEPVAAGPVTQLRRELALHMDAGLQRNAPQLTWMMTTFHIASVLLTLEILAWVAAIAVTG